MTEVMEEQNVYQDQFQRLTDRADARWGFLAPVREKAMQRFAELGFPTTKDEEWRFTSVKPIASAAFALPEPGEEAAVDQSAIAPYRFDSAGGPTLVFVDGRFSEALSSLEDMPADAEVMTLAEAAAGDERETLEAHLARHAGFDHDAFTALNTAFIEQGAYVRIPKNKAIEKPIHLLYVSKGGDAARVAHPRNVIVAEGGSEATVIEQYVGLDEGVYFSNAVTEIAVGANANLHHYMLERESERAYNIGTLRVQQERDSHFESHTALFGGAIVRNNVHASLNGENCHSLINGLFMPRDKQHMDNHMRVEHNVPHCESRQYYNGVLDDTSRGVFGGRIYVERDAQKTDAVQTNRNLLLTDSARVNTKPQLEIYADDVKCTHGATTGQLDKEALYYLRARGIPEAEARGLLVYAFAKESLDRLTIEPVRDAMEQLLKDRLPQREKIEALAGQA